MQRTRYRDLVPGAECGNFAYIDRLEHDHIEDGRWASPLTNTPRIQVFSPNYCPHNEYTVDPQPLAWDCSPCTTKVCQGIPSAATRGRRPPGGPQRAWPKPTPSARPTVSSGRRGCRGRRICPRPRPAPSSPSSCRGRRAPCCASTATAARAHPRRSLAGHAIRSGRARPSACASTAARRATRWAARCWARFGPIRRSRRRWPARSPSRATVPDAQLHAPRLLVHLARQSQRQRVRLRDRSGDGRRAGGAADAGPQRHRPRPALRAQRARGGRGARTRVQRLRRQRLRHDRRPAARRLDRRMCGAPPKPARRGPARRRSTAGRTPPSPRAGSRRRRTGRTRSIRRCSRAACTSTAAGARLVRESPGTQQGTITLASGQRYHLRWDRFQAEPPLAARRRGSRGSPGCQSGRADSVRRSCTCWLPAAAAG